MFTTDKNPVIEFITSDNGKLSASRILVILTVLCYLVFVGFVTIKTKVLPDIPMGVTALISALYAAGKFGTRDN